MLQRRRVLGLLCLLAVVVTLSGCLTKSGELTGVVRALNGTPVEGAIVKVNGVSRTTNADGAFKYQELKYGTYTLTVEWDGETLYSGKVSINKKVVNVAVEIDTRTPEEIFTMLSSFEDESSLDLLALGNIVTVEVSNDRATDGDSSLKTVFGPTTGWPKVTLELNGDAELPTDWTPYAEFKMDIYNPQDEKVRFDIKFNSENGSSDSVDGAKAIFLLPNEWSEVTIPVAKIAEAGVDITAMTGVEFWQFPLEEAVTFYLDNIHLLFRIDI